MTRKSYTLIAAPILLALLALLIYSLDRTSWLLAQYELSQPGTLADWLGLSPLALGVAAALVIEVGAVALVAGDVLALERSAIKRYAVAGLAVVVSVQALANLLAGYLRGWATVDQALVAHDVSADMAWWIAGFAWVLSSAAVPALIFILSQLAAHVVRLAMSAQIVVAKQPQKGAQERSVTAQAPEVVAETDDAGSAALSAADDRPLVTVSAPLGGERSSAQADGQSLMDERWPISAGAVIALNRYPCPHCGAALVNGRAVGAAKTNGFCSHCKEVRIVK